jgi:ribosomal protein S18 acetylase RimI-like enzyme
MRRLRVRGVGRALMRAIAEHVRKVGREYVALSVRVDRLLGD